MGIKNEAFRYFSSYERLEFWNFLQATSRNAVRNDNAESMSFVETAAKITVFETFDHHNYRHSKSAILTILQGKKPRENKSMMKINLSIEYMNF